MIASKREKGGETGSKTASDSRRVGAKWPQIVVMNRLSVQGENSWRETLGRYLVSATASV